MQAGKIYVAEHEGVYVLQLTGDVRLTLCTTIDEYLQRVFESPSFVAVMVDVCQAEGLDSTTLGMLAKLAVKSRSQHHLTPILLSLNPNITRLFSSMGFEKVFDIREEPLRGCCCDQLGELPVVDADEEAVRCRVIEAHRILMDMNEQNHATFVELVSSLETVATDIPLRPH